MTRKMHGRHDMLRMACYVLVLIIVVVLIATKVVTPRGLGLSALFPPGIGIDYGDEMGEQGPIPTAVALLLLWEIGKLIARGARDHTATAPAAAASPA